MKTKLLSIFITFEIPIPNKCRSLIMDRYWNPVSERCWNPVSQRCWIQFRNDVGIQYRNDVGILCRNDVGIQYRIGLTFRHPSDTGMLAANIGTTLFEYWNPTWEGEITFQQWDSLFILLWNFRKTFHFVFHWRHIHCHDLIMNYEV